MLSSEKRDPLVVLDTNVLISYLLGSTNAGKIVRGAVEGHFTPVISEALPQEFIRTVYKPRIARFLGPKYALKFIEDWREGARCATPIQKFDVCEDPSDNMLFECAVVVRARYIVSGDKAVQSVRKFEGINVLSPKTFIEKVLFT